MSRRSQCSSNQCYCCCKKNRDTGVYRPPVESIIDGDDLSCYKYPRSGQSNVNCRVQANNPVLDDETWQDLSSLRQKACNFIKSDSEESTSSESAWRQNTYVKESCHNSKNINNLNNNMNLVRKASDLIDYVPESEFLKKVKEQCQYWQNQPPQGVLPSYTEAIDIDPYRNQNCFPKPRPVQNFPNPPCTGGEVREEPGKRRKGCPCPCIREPPKSGGLDYKKNIDKTVNEPKVMFRQYKSANDCVPVEENECYTEGTKKSGKKSEHVSRSKKVDFRGSKKEKTDSKEQIESEHKLKKPHENSCERCWRYASPSRSPVNKPEQRYDPNFRKAHSCTDLESEKGDENLKLMGKHISPCKNLQPVFNKNFVPLKLPEPEKKISSSKMKELVYDYSGSREGDKYTQRTRTFEECKKCEPQASRGLIYSDERHKPRPKSCTPGVSPPRNVCDLSGFLEDLDVTEYKEIRIRPRKLSFEEDTPCAGPTRNGDSRSPNYRENVFSSSRGHEQENSRLRDYKSAENESNFETSRSLGNRRTDSNRKSQNSATAKWEGGQDQETSSKNVKLSTPKKSGGGSPRGGRGKKSASPKHSKRDQNSGKSPRGKRSENSPPNRTKSPNIKGRRLFNEICPQYVEDPPMTPCRTMQTNTCKPYNQMPECGMPSTVYTGPPHPIKDCDCYPRIPRSRRGNDVSESDGPIFCCHCRWKESLRNQPNPNCRTSPCANQRNETAYERQQPPYQPNVEVNQRQFVNNPNYTYDCGYNTPYRNEILDKTYVISPRVLPERVMACPYQEYTNERSPLKSHNLPENVRFTTRPCENFSTSVQRAPGRYSPGNSGYFPKKYCVFYMTKSKEEKGDEVEVLVEELTQTNSNRKDTKTKDLAEKMKRVLECQSDSMALRFQKGMSDSCKNLQSSRILYF